jgi:hypothetical protein
MQKAIEKPVNRIDRLRNIITAVSSDIMDSPYQT